MKSIPIQKPFTSAHLSDLATIPGNYTDPEFSGLVFAVERRVQGANRTCWKIRFAVHGETFSRKIGDWPKCSLEEARERATLARGLLGDLVDPGSSFARFTDGKRGPKIIRGLWLEFVKCEEDTGSRLFSNCRADSYSRAQRYLFPYFGDSVPAEVSCDDIAKALNAAYARLSETTVRKIRQDIQRFFRWCRAHRLLDVSMPLPSDSELIRPLLRKPTTRIQSTPHPALAEKDVPRFVAALLVPEKIWQPGVLAIVFALLTASRIGNVVGSYSRIRTQAAKWSDFDRGFRLWTIQAQDMKAGRYGGNHVVPLSREARNVLLLAQAWQERYGKSEFVFTMRSTARLSYQRLYKIFREFCDEDRKGFFDSESGKPIHIHGFRSTFKTWCTNHGVDSVLSEICLHHITDALRYDRAKAVSRRKKVMQDWANFCLSKTSADWFEIAQVNCPNVTEATSSLQKEEPLLLLCYERRLLIEYKR